MDKRILVLFLFGWIFAIGGIFIVWLGVGLIFLDRLFFVICGNITSFCGIGIIFRCPPIFDEDEIVELEKIKAYMILNFEYISFLIFVTLLYAFSLNFLWAGMREYYAIIVAGITGAFWSWGIIEIREKSKGIKTKSKEQIYSKSFQSLLRKSLISAIFWFVLFIVELIIITILTVTKT